MAKKSIAGAAGASADIFDTIASAGAQNTDNTHNTDNTNNTKDTGNTDTITDAPPKNPVGRPRTKDKDDYYRLNLSIPKEYKTYLKTAAFEASSPEKIVSITEYVCRLIKADMDKHNKK